MEEPMTTPRGTADAESLGVTPLRMSVVLGASKPQNGPRPGRKSTGPSGCFRPDGPAERERCTSFRP